MPAARRLAGICSLVAVGSRLALAAGAESEVSDVEQQDDLVALVQQSAHVSFQRGGAIAAGAQTPAAKKCLRFIHNPRTGGTSIDSLNLHLPRGQRAYGSLMDFPLDAAAGSERYPNMTPGELFDIAHGSELQDESSAAAGRFYGENYLWNFNFRWCSWQYDNFVQNCQDLHTPAHHDPLVGAFFSEPGCTNFCVVRDPMKRILSTYKFQALGPCSDAGFSDWIERTYPLTQPIGFCHGYPQVEYVYNARSKANATHQWCNRVLRLENLTADYNALMSEFDRPLKMEVHFFSTSACNIDTTNISQAAKDKIYQYYREDYRAFGYPRPQ